MADQAKGVPAPPAPAQAGQQAQQQQQDHPAPPAHAPTAQQQVSKKYIKTGLILSQNFPGNLMRMQKPICSAPMTG